MEFFKIEKLKNYSSGLGFKTDRKELIVKNIGLAIENHDIHFLDNTFDESCTFYGYSDNPGTKKEFLNFIQAYKGRPHSRFYQISSTNNIIECQVKAFYEVSKILGQDNYISWKNTFIFNDKNKIITAFIKHYNVHAKPCDIVKWSIYIQQISKWYPYEKLSTIAYLPDVALKYIAHQNKHNTSQQLQLSKDP